MKYKMIVMGLILATALAACTGCAAQSSGNAAYEGSDGSNVQTTSEPLTSVPAMESAADSTSATPKDESSVDSSESDINSITPKDDIGLAAASDDAFYAIPIPDEIFAKMDRISQCLHLETKADL